MIQENIIKSINVYNGIIYYNDKSIINLNLLRVIQVCNINRYDLLIVNQVKRKYDSITNT